VQSLGRGAGVLVGYHVAFHGAIYLHQRSGESIHRPLRRYKIKRHTGQNSNGLQEPMLGAVKKTLKQLCDILRRGEGR
jgi:hypothetical protein